MFHKLFFFLLLTTTFLTETHAFTALATHTVLKTQRFARTAVTAAKKAKMQRRYDKKMVKARMKAHSYGKSMAGALVGSKKDLTKPKHLEKWNRTYRAYSEGEIAFHRLLNKHTIFKEETDIANVITKAATARTRTVDKILQGKK